MYRRIYSWLFRKDSLTNEERIELERVLYRDYFSPLKSRFAMSEIVSMATPVYFRKDDVIFAEADLVENCYFLLEGRIGCYKINPRLKSVVSSDLVEVIEKQDIIGYFIFNNNRTRAFSAISHADEGASVLAFSIPYYRLKSISAVQIEEHTYMKYMLKCFLGSTTNILNRVNLRGGINYKQFRCFAQIHLYHELGIIVNGYCELRRQLQGYLADHGKGRIRLSRMDCVNLEGYLMWKNQKFEAESITGDPVIGGIEDAVMYTILGTKYFHYSYIVNTEYILLLCLPFNLIGVFPRLINERLNFLAKCHNYSLTKIDKPTHTSIHNENVNNLSIHSPPYLLQQSLHYQPLTQRKQCAEISSPSSLYKNTQLAIEDFKKYYCLDYSAYALSGRKKRSKLKGESRKSLLQDGDDKILLKALSPIDPIRNQPWGHYLLGAMHRKQKEKYMTEREKIILGSCRLSTNLHSKMKVTPYKKEFIRFSIPVVYNIYEYQICVPFSLRYHLPKDHKVYMAKLKSRPTIKLPRI